MVSQNNYFRWAIKPVFLAQYNKFVLCTDLYNKISRITAVQALLSATALTCSLSGLVNIGICVFEYFCHGWHLFRMNWVYHCCVLLTIFLGVSVHLGLAQPSSPHHAVVQNTCKCFFALSLKHPLFQFIVRGKCMILQLLYKVWNCSIQLIESVVWLARTCPCSQWKCFYQLVGAVYQLLCR